MADAALYNRGLPARPKEEGKIVRQTGFLFAALALAAVAGLAMVALAQAPPTEQSSFCLTCHPNLHIRFTDDGPVVQKPPQAPHPLAEDWTSSDCASCHRLQHNGRNATHSISKDQEGGQFCVACHIAGQGPFTGDEPAGFCISCHKQGQSSGE